MSAPAARPPGLLEDGGARQGEADLWCSYAAIRALHWLGTKPARSSDAVDFLLSRQNPDGGYAWQRGLPSDVWATYYCTQALADLGEQSPATDRLAAWMSGLRTADGGFAMTPGQHADIWATYYAARIHADILHSPVPDIRALGRWLAGTQTAEGGLTWAPGGTVPDVRACYYGALAWRAAAGRSAQPWRREPLVGWLCDQQEAGGGFRFGPGYEPCAWAVFRAVRALAALDADARDAAAVRRWLGERRLPGRGYERWQGYGAPDVWACFSAVGALATLDAMPGPAEREEVTAFIESCQLPGSGFTYVRPEAAGDSLATAAALILETLAPTAGPDANTNTNTNADADAKAGDALVAWLRRAHLPYEGGVMYMPGRGAEVRCTLWAAEALSTVGSGLNPDRIGRWLRELQNPDGGFGYWLGRGSDLVSTVSAVETAARCGTDQRHRLDADGALRFIESCRAGDRMRPAPGAGPSIAATAQAARALDLLGRPDRARELCLPFADLASPLGGFGATERSLPDLMTTYQVALSQQALGLPVDLAGLRRFLAKVRAGSGFAWSPLSRRPAGPLADCLGAQLDRLAAADAPAAARLLRLNL